ncbi:uncharacterized protein [Manis javanica]|uniref:uncharacterized protein n=1 Tax=Manis javanica TaxID=9974 RepID=UPI003C6CEFA1
MEKKVQDKVEAEVHALGRGAGRRVLAACRDGGSGGRAGVRRGNGPEGAGAGPALAAGRASRRQPGASPAVAAPAQRPSARVSPPPSARPGSAGGGREAAPARRARQLSGGRRGGPRAARDTKNAPWRVAVEERQERKAVQEISCSGPRESHTCNSNVEQREKDGRRMQTERQLLTWVSLCVPWLRSLLGMLSAKGSRDHLCFLSPGGRWHHMFTHSFVHQAFAGNLL